MRFPVQCVFMYHAATFLKLFSSLISEPNRFTDGGGAGAYSIRRGAGAGAISPQGDENLTLTLVQGMPSHERPPPT